jgi:hypothetical protein
VNPAITFHRDRFSARDDLPRTNSL